MRNRFFLVLFSVILVIGLNACSLKNDNNEGTRDFLAGKISAEQAAKDINRKIMLYLNE